MMLMFPSSCRSIHSFIHSAISIAPLQVLYYSEALPTQHGYCIGVSRRSAQATVGKGLAQGPYMAARAGVKPTTLRLKAVDSTKAPPCPFVPWSTNGSLAQWQSGYKASHVSLQSVLTSWFACFNYL